MKTSFLGSAKPTVADMVKPLNPFFSREEKPGNGTTVRICPGCSHRISLAVTKCACGWVPPAKPKRSDEPKVKDKKNSGLVHCGRYAGRSTGRPAKAEGKLMTLKRVPESAHKFLGVAADGRKIFNLVG